MAIYRCSMQVISRTKGQTSTAAAAYRSAMSIEDLRTGVVNDYSRRRGVESVEMFAPADTPDWARDPSSLWNAAESVERKNGRPAREWLVALPHELSPAQRKDLVRALACELVDRYGVAVMAAVHEPSERGDDRNFHVHLLFTTRRVGAGGLGKKVRELDDRTTGPQEVEQLRIRSGEIINRHLAAAGYAERVDHRRLAVQAEEAEQRGDFAKAFLLTKQVERTEGRAATAARRRGERTGATEWNASVRKDNDEVLRHYVARAERAAHSRPAVAQRRVHAPSVRRVPRRATLPSSIVAAIERSSGAFGPGGHVINQQSRQARLSRREHEEAVRRFIRMLEDEMARIHRNHRKIIAYYAIVARLERADIRALAAHCERDPACALLLRRTIRVRRAMLRHRRAVERRRAEHGAAMANTARAQSAMDAGADRHGPPLWKPMRRREWAELRRRQRKELADAVVAEHAAAAAADPKRLGEVVRAETQAQADLDTLEWQRRDQFPLPSDVVARQPGRQMAAKGAGKIPNKIATAKATQGAPKPKFAYEPRPVRRRAPR